MPHIDTSPEPKKLTVIRCSRHPWSEQKVKTLSQKLGVKVAQSKDHPNCIVLSGHWSTKDVNRKFKLAETVTVTKVSGPKDSRLPFQPMFNTTAES